MKPTEEHFGTTMAGGPDSERQRRLREQGIIRRIEDDIVIEEFHEDKAPIKRYSNA